MDRDLVKSFVSSLFQLFNIGREVSPKRHHPYLNFEKLNFRKSLVKVRLL